MHINNLLAFIQCKKTFVLITCFLLLFTKINAQQLSSNPLPLHKKNIFTLGLYKQPGQDSLVDFVDGVYRIFKINKSRSLAKKMEKPLYAYVPGVEYNLASGLGVSYNTSVVLPSKFLSANQSLVFGQIKATQKKQAVAQLVSTLWLKKDEYNITTNWSYLKFPQLDFGLGSKSSLDLFDNLDYTYLKLYQSVLKKVAPNLYMGPGLNIDYHWNISDTTTRNKPVNGFTQYGFAKNTTSVGLVFTILYDTRKQAVNPVANSHYLNLMYRDNRVALGSDQQWQSLLFDYRYYLPFPKNSKNILAFWTYNVVTLQGKPPYLDLPTSGSDTYGNTSRGYMQGRFRGDRFLSAESEYRFRITENGFLGGVVFANMQSLSAQPGAPLQGFLPGYGAGLRIKLNKFSNTNIALDYGFGKGGSKGLFLNLGEVF